MDPSSKSLRNRHAAWGRGNPVGGPEDPGGNPWISYSNAFLMKRRCDSRALLRNPWDSLISGFFSQSQACAGETLVANTSLKLNIVGIDYRFAGIPWNIVSQPRSRTDIVKYRIATAFAHRYRRHRLATRSKCVLMIQKHWNSIGNIDMSRLYSTKSLKFLKKYWHFGQFRKTDLVCQYSDDVIGLVHVSWEKRKCCDLGEFRRTYFVRQCSNDVTGLALVSWEKRKWCHFGKFRRTDFVCLWSWRIPQDWLCSPIQQWCHWIGTRVTETWKSQSVWLETPQMSVARLETCKCQLWDFKLAMFD